MDNNFISLNTIEFQKYCSNILLGLDANELSMVTNALEIHADNNNLHMSITNGEYKVSVTMPTNINCSFHATVNAELLLKLVSQITTENIDLCVKDNILMVVGNGEYKLPILYDNDVVLELPTINIENVVDEFDIDGAVLMSILNYNSKQLSIGTISKPIQKLYYIDNQGAITFTSGACVNMFNIPCDIKLLLNNKIVKLFKLFEGKLVHCIVGNDLISKDIIQTKIKFICEDVEVSAIVSCDNSMLNSMPVNAIRSRVEDVYDYSVTLDKSALLKSINRLMLFNTKSDFVIYNKFIFGPQGLVLYDSTGNNKEELSYIKDGNKIDTEYVANIDISELKGVLESCFESYVQLHFGNHEALLLNRSHVYNIIPEIEI